MLTNTDIILLLYEMKDKGQDVTKDILKATTSRNIDIDILKKVNDFRQLEVSRFYTMLRKNYNQKKSKLYKNLVKEEITLEETLTTLSSLLQQIVLYNNKLEEKDRIMFLKHSRAEDISNVLKNYFTNYDINGCLKLLQLIKADLKVFEAISR